jgi:hypothetical protein
VQLDDPATKQQARQKHDDYYANVGDAIRTLREETPTLFQKDLTCEDCDLFEQYLHLRASQALFKLSGRGCSRVVGGGLAGTYRLAGCWR